MSCPAAVGLALMIDPCRVADKRQGRGTLYFVHSGKYQGEWLNDVYHGQGELVFANNDVFRGTVRIRGVSAADIVAHPVVSNE